MAYEYQDLPQQLQEVSVGDYRRECPSCDIRRTVRRRSPTPGRVYSPVRAWETGGAVRWYAAEKEEEFLPGPSRVYAAAEHLRPEG